MRRRARRALGWVAGGDNQFVHAAQFGRHLNVVHTRAQTEGDLKIRKRFRSGVHALAGLFEPAGDFREVERLELVGSKPNEADAAALRTPDARREGGTRTAGNTYSAPGAAFAIPPPG